MAQIKPFEYLIYDELTKHLTGTNGHHLTDNKIKMGAFKRYEHTHYDDLTQNKKDFLNRSYKQICNLHMAELSNFGEWYIQYKIPSPVHIQNPKNTTYDQTSTNTLVALSVMAVYVRVSTYLEKLIVNLINPSKLQQFPQCSFSNIGVVILKLKGQINIMLYLSANCLKYQYLCWII